MGSERRAEEMVHAEAVNVHQQAALVDQAKKGRPSRSFPSPCLGFPFPSPCLAFPFPCCTCSGWVRARSGCANRRWVDDDMGAVLDTRAARRGEGGGRGGTAALALACRCPVSLCLGVDLGRRGLVVAC